MTVNVDDHPELAGQYRVSVHIHRIRPMIHIFKRKVDDQESFYSSATTCIID